MTLQEFEKEIDRIHKREKEILLKKNQDYGFAVITGDDDIWLLFDISSRLKEKCMRLRNLLKNKIKNDTKENFESIEDTLIDIQGYTTLGQVLLNRNGM